MLLDYNSCFVRDDLGVIPSYRAIGAFSCPAELSAYLRKDFDILMLQPPFHVADLKTATTLSTLPF